MADASNSSPTSANQLLSRMMRKELYLISSKCLVDPSTLQDHLLAHLSYMIELEKTGVLFASGPLFDGKGAFTGDGITIVRAASFDEASQIADQDPFARANLRRSSVHRWIVNEGRITVSVDLSDRGATLP